MLTHLLSIKNDNIHFKMKLEERTSFFTKQNGYVPQLSDFNFAEMHFQKEINHSWILLGTISKKVNWFNSKKINLKFKFNKTIKNIDEIREMLIKNLYKDNFDSEIILSLKDDVYSNISLYFSYNHNNTSNLLNIYNSIIEMIRLLGI